MTGAVGARIAGGIDRRTVIERLRVHREEWRAMGVQWLMLFGSVARDDAGPESDVDVLVEFSRPVGLFAFVRLRDRLAAVLGRDVDLVTVDSLKDPIRARVLKDVVEAA